MSGIQKMYAGKRVLMTGTTGFVGKCLLEKLLRDVPELDKVFILIRPKKNISPQQRAIDEIATSPIFNRIREQVDPRDFWK
jgi:fatty acyl-CoA reductase